MRKLHNTLHVMTQGAYLHRDGETVSVKIGDELKLRVPIHTLEGLVCWGRVSCSPPVLGLCCEHGVGISFLTEQGRFIARVSGPVSGNVLLRRQQYQIADDERRSLPIVQTILAAKIANSRVVLLRAALLWTTSMRCSRSSTRCSATTSSPRWKASALTPPSASCTPTGPGVPVLRST